MKITITNAYTWFNKGDAGILLGTINTLKKIYINEPLEINVLSFTPDEDKKRYCEDKCIKDVYSNVLNPRPYKNTKIGKLKAIIKLFFKMLYIETMIKINPKRLLQKMESIQKINESDLVIVCGGGFLGGKKYDSLMHLFQIHIDRIFNKNVVIIGTSIEPINNGIIRKFTEKIIKKVDFVFAREKITYEYLLTFLDQKKISLIPDMAFMLEDNNLIDNRIQKLKKGNNLICGLTVRRWSFPNSNNPKQKMANYISVLAQTIDYFYEKENMSFVFIPQVIVQNGNDADVALQIKDKLINEKALTIITDDISPVMIKSLISNCDIFLGTRMHSNIFAISMNVPTVAIAYEKKTNGIMHTVELDRYVLEMDNINFDMLRKKIEECKSNKSLITKNLKKKIPEIRKEIFDEVNKILKGSVK